METKNIGLRGIEVADTKISNIDGEKGRLIYRGYDILDLTKNSTFDDCVQTYPDSIPQRYSEYYDIAAYLVTPLRLYLLGKMLFLLFAPNAFLAQRNFHQTRRLGPVHEMCVGEAPVRVAP